MDNFDETELNNNHKKKIQWTHVSICIIVLSIFFIILSIILNKDEQDFLFNQVNVSNWFSNSSKKEENNNSENTIKEADTNIPDKSNQPISDNSNDLNENITDPTKSTETIEQSQPVDSPETTNPTETIEQTQPETPTQDPGITTEEIPSSITSTALTPEQYEKIIHIYTQSPNKTVYLTFDDGPSPNVTPLILDELKKQNIKATFFMLGTNATYYPDLVKRAYEEGHYIANHGYSHKYSEIYQNTDTVLNDYQLCEQALKKALGNNDYQSKVYRFPGGSSGGYYDAIKKDAKNLLKENNIAYLDWNALTYDAENAHTKESILENLANTVGEKNVVVLLMHDSSSKILTYDSLPDVINFFRERGYNFNTLYDALQ